MAGGLRGCFGEAPRAIQNGRLLMPLKATSLEEMVAQKEAATKEVGRAEEEEGDDSFLNSSKDEGGDEADRIFDPNKSPLHARAESQESEEVPPPPAKKQKVSAKTPKVVTSKGGAKPKRIEPTKVQAKSSKPSKVTKAKEKQSVQESSASSESTAASTESGSSGSDSEASKA